MRPVFRIRPAPAAAMVVAALTLALTLAGCGGSAAAPGGDEPAVRTSDDGPVITPPGDGRGGPTRPGDAELAEDDCDDSTLQPAEGNLDRIRAATLCLINAERTQRDLPALDANADLRSAANQKAHDMVDDRYFAHVGPDERDVRDWVSDTGYVRPAQGYALGENLAWASEGAATPARIVRSWMRSPGHRENILRERYEDSGIGVALGAPREAGGGGATYVQVFGSR